MSIKTNLIVAATVLLGETQLFAQSAGSSVSLQYGTVKAVEILQAQSRHARGAVLGGIIAGFMPGDAKVFRASGHTVAQPYMIALLKAEGDRY